MEVHLFHGYEDKMFFSFRGEKDNMSRKNDPVRSSGKGLLIEKQLSVVTNSGLSQRLYKMSSVDLIANYLPIREHHSQDMPTVLCQKCPRLAGSNYENTFKDLKCGQLIELPSNVRRDFTHFLKTHANTKTITIDDYFTIFLSS